jgi:hypothetical protein
MFGIEMHDDHKSGACIIWQRGEEPLQRVNAACRCANGDDDGELLFVSVRGPGTFYVFVFVVCHDVTLCCQPDRASAYPLTRERC